MSLPFVVAFVAGVTPGKWARVWNERMPQQALELRPLSPADALDALAQGEAQVALMRLPVDNNDLSTIPLYEELPVVVVPKDHAIEAVESVTLAELEPENVIAGDWADAVELVAANVGVAIMPQSVARAYSRRDVVARFVSDGETSRIALVWVTNSTTPLVEEFIGVVRGRTANSSRGAQPEPQPAPVRKAPARKTVKPVPRTKFPNKKKR